MAHKSFTKTARIKTNFQVVHTEDTATEELLDTEKSVTEELAELNNNSGDMIVITNDIESPEIMKRSNMIFSI